MNFNQTESEFVTDELENYYIAHLYNATETNILQNFTYQDYYKSSAYNNLVKHQYIVSGWLSLIFAIVGILGNILTIRILCKPNMATITNTFIIGLSFSDIISLSLVIFLVPLRNILVDHNTLGFYYIHTYLYPILYPIATTFQFTSIYLMVVTCFSRVISLYFPASYCLKSPQKCYVTILLIFVFSALSCLPLWFYYKVDYVTQGNISKIILNYTKIALNSAYRSYVHTYIIILTNCIPLVILTILNYYLVSFLYKTRRRRHRLGIRERNELMITGILIMFVLLFFVCQLPNFLLHVLQATNVSFTSTISQTYFRQWANFLLILNSSYSFIIYCCLSGEFREEAKKIFTCNNMRSYMDEYNKYTSRASVRRGGCAVKKLVVSYSAMNGNEIIRISHMEDSTTL